MEPYIQNVDTNTPLGLLVYRYGKREYYKGLMLGLIIGLALSHLHHLKRL